MQALLLAAGMGKRLGKYTENKTKCMVEINNTTLVERVINNLLDIGINKLIVVIGYKGDVLRKYLVENFKNMKFEFIENNDYSTTNNIYSLWLAKEKLIEDDTILIESDLIFEKKLLEELINQKDDNIAVLSKYQKFMDGTVVTLNTDNNIQRFFEKSEFNKEMEKDYYKTVNIYKFSKEFLKNEYIPFLKTCMDVYGKNNYYEIALKIISNLGRSKIKGLDVSKMTWYEIDNEEDLNNAKELFKNKDE